MHNDERESWQRQTRMEQDGFTQADERITEEDLHTEDAVRDSKPHRFPTSAIRMQAPLQGAESQASRRNVNVPEYTSGRIVIPTMPTRSGRGATTRQFPPIQEQRSKPHWLLYIGVGMIGMLTLLVLSSAALAWGLARYNDLRYGNPRTFQTDAVVGHSDDPAHPSHFIAINLHRHIVVVEFMGGNPAKAISYTGPYLFDPSGELTPVTLEFRDVTGDGKPDMLIHIQDQTIVFVNDGTMFRPQKSGDNIRL